VSPGSVSMKTPLHSLRISSVASVSRPTTLLCVCYVTVHDAVVFGLCLVDGSDVRMVCLSGSMFVLNFVLVGLGDS